MLHINFICINNNAEASRYVSIGSFFFRLYGKKKGDQMDGRPSLYLSRAGGHFFCRYFKYGAFCPLSFTISVCESMMKTRSLPFL